MAFDRLTRLGKEKFQKVCNELMRGAPVVLVARLIQSEWGDVQGVAECTLAQQLRRLHAAITNGAFGGDLAQEAKARATVRIKLFHGSSLSVLDELVDVAMLQKFRVGVGLEKERLLKKHIPGLDTAIKDYKDLLLAIQKVKFDLGLDEYRREIPIRPETIDAPSDQVRQAHKVLAEVLERHSQ